jgi:hypothetical protein
VTSVTEGNFFSGACRIARHLPSLFKSGRRGQYANHSTQLLPAAGVTRGRMTTAVFKLLRWLRGGIATALMLFAAGAAVAQPAQPTTAPVPPGEARVWFYRVFFPDDTGGMPAVSMNGNTVGYARAGWSFYRDVPAGNYHVTVQTFGVEVDPAKDLTLAPGAEVYLAIQSDPTWVADRPGFRRPTYWVDIEPPQIAAIHFAQAQLGSGY